MLLCTNEASRLARKRAPADTAASAAATLLLLRAAGAAPGAVLVRPALSHGRPSLAAAPSVSAAAADANASHDGSWVVAAKAPSAAAATGARVGIDVISLARLSISVASSPAFSRYFAPGERALLSAASAAGPEHATIAFAVLWSLKEALVKALGCGLTQRLSGLDFSGTFASSGSGFDVAAAAKASSPLSPIGASLECKETISAVPFWAPDVRCVTSTQSKIDLPPPLPNWHFCCYRLDAGHVVSVALWNKQSTTNACGCGEPCWHEEPIGSSLSPPGTEFIPEVRDTAPSASAVAAAPLSTLAWICEAEMLPLVSVCAPPKLN